MSVAERAGERDLRAVAEQLLGRPLKKAAASEYVGPCPACRDGDDRFGVNVKKQLWHCRHCGKGGDVIALVMHVKGVGFRDAVERLAAGGRDEDKAKNQNAVAANMRRILEQIDVHIAGVGHTGKDERRGERGSNARLGDVDLQVRISGYHIRTAEIVKANDQPEGVLTTFALEEIRLCEDPDGDPIFTTILDPDATPASSRVKKQGRPKGSPAAANALAALRLAVEECGQIPHASNRVPPGVRTINLELWKRYLAQSSVSGTKSPEALRKAFERAVERLQADGFIGVWNENVWPTDK